MNFTPIEVRIFVMSILEVKGKPCVEAEALSSYKYAIITKCNIYDYYIVNMSHREFEGKLATLLWFLAESLGSLSPCFRISAGAGGAG